jgi:hypothetical protein
MMLTFYISVNRAIILDSLLTVVHASRFSNFLKIPVGGIYVYQRSDFSPRVQPRCGFTYPTTERVAGLFPE